MRLLLDLSIVTCLVLACVSTALAAPRPRILARKGYNTLRSAIDEHDNAADKLMALYSDDSKEAAAASILLQISKGTGDKNAILWPRIDTAYLDNEQSTPFENPEEAKEIIGKAVLQLKKQGDLKLPDVSSREAPSQVYQHLTIQEQIREPERVVYSDKSTLIVFGIVYNGDPDWQRGHSVFVVLDSNGKSTLVAMDSRPIVK